MPNTTSTGIIYLQGKYGAQCGHQQPEEHVSQSFNPNMCIRVTRLVHGCYGRHGKGHLIINTAHLGQITRQYYNLESFEMDRHVNLSS